MGVAARMGASSGSMPGWLCGAAELPALPVEERPEAPSSVGGQGTLAAACLRLACRYWGKIWQRYCFADGMGFHGHSHANTDGSVVATDDVSDHLVAFIEFDYRSGVRGSEPRCLWSPDH
jgi:hypothetical protein